MVKVYFESERHAELVAIFETSEAYNACSKALEKCAKKDRMFVTESVEEESLDNLVDKKEPQEQRPEKHTYLLLGSEAVDAYGDGNIGKAVKAFGDVHDFNHAVDSAESLLAAYDGWQNWCEITKEEYETYLKIRK